MAKVHRLESTIVKSKYRMRVVKSRISVSVRASPWKYLDFERILSTLVMASFTINALASSKKYFLGTVFLRCGKAGFVDPVVQLLVNPLIALFDLVHQVGGSQVKRRILANMIELAI